MHTINSSTQLILGRSHGLHAALLRWRVSESLRHSMLCKSPPCWNQTIMMMLIITIITITITINSDNSNSNSNGNNATSNHQGLVHFCSRDPKRRANAAFLICAYQAGTPPWPACNRIYPIYLVIYLSIYLSIYVSIYMRHSSSVHTRSGASLASMLFIYIHIYIYICTYIYIYIYYTLYLSLSTYIYIYIYMYTYIYTQMCILHHNVARMCLNVYVHDHAHV